jgi:hypothetical protein
VTTRLQVSAYRFWMRRLELTLLRRDTLMRDDPIRSQLLAFTTGCVLAALAVAACVIFAMVGSPAP